MSELERVRVIAHVPSRKRGTGSSASEGTSETVLYVEPPANVYQCVLGCFPYVIELNDAIAVQQNVTMLSCGVLTAPSQL